MDIKDSALKEITY